MELSYYGNKNHLKLPKVAFIASRRILPAQVLKCYDWATAQREAGTCVMSGFHSPLERDVLGFLLKGKQPVIIVLARKLYKLIPEHWKVPLAEGRLLIISTSKADRASTTTTHQRNRFLITEAQKIVVGSVAPSSSLEKLISEFTISKFIYL